MENKVTDKCANERTAQFLALRELEQDFMTFMHIHRGKYTNLDTKLRSLYSLVV
jgi:hypothetical protein